MDKAHITRYQEIKNSKQTYKGGIHDYLENIKVSISILQNKSSAVIKSTIYRSSKSINSSNDTNNSEISAFSSASNITTESNSRTFSNGSTIFGIDVNFKNPITSNNIHITIAISDLIISEGLSFNLYQKPRFKNLLELAINVPKKYIPTKKKLIPK